MTNQAEAAASDPPISHEAPQHHQHLTTEIDGTVLATEADAELLGELRDIVLEFPGSNMSVCARQDGLQAGAQAKLQYDRDIRYCLLHHGPAPFDRQYPRVLAPRRSRWDGLEVIDSRCGTIYGQEQIYLTRPQLVSSIWLYFCRRISYG